MDKLSAELQRLHVLTPAASHHAFGLAFTRADDWPAIAELCRAVQEELDLPTPAISIDGTGYQLWFSLTEAVEAGQATAFLAGLLRRHLPDLPSSRVRFALPDEAPPHPLAGDDERWAAFIDPGMGSLFTGEPWLDMPPNRNQQADLLATVTAMPASDFSRTLARLDAADGTDKLSADPLPSRLSIEGSFTDPRQFLLAVMNDPGASAQHRIDAAKALLPYFEKAL